MRRKGNDPNEIKDVSLVSGSRGIPEFLSIGVVALFQIWKRKMLLSLASGTLVYMFFIRLFAYNQF
ncbi:AzlD domain-containing protein [Brevibacillus brevis]|uniref:AzlD domain-containing protein n=1 Tax=Brevibacillus brevis TaxID=1393 RepID=A0ABY9TB63_BREBE|nr:AzlD domain-containing protein [Brevibacillus brevis]WNC17347.1 AzlD domain-containing protein [Brevibacillus brevis]